MNLYRISFVLFQGAFVFASYFPSLSYQERVKKNVERQFGGPDRYEEFRRASVLRFFQQRIAFENAAQKLREPEKIVTSAYLKHIYRLAQPKVAVEEPIILPAVIPKKISEEEKIALFDRLAEPKNRPRLYEEPVKKDCSRKHAKKNKKNFSDA